MVRPSLRVEETVAQEIKSDIVGMLEDLVKSSSTKKDLAIGAKVYWLGFNMGIDMTVALTYRDILAGENKHKVNFLEE